MEMNELLLRTAFACMSCDGEIAPEEVDGIKRLHKEKHLFGDVDIEQKLDELVKEINTKGKRFLKQYLNSVGELDLSEDNELKIAQTAVETIWLDKIVQYSEIKFFKLLRSKFKNVSDDTLLEKVEGIDESFLAPDIRDDYSQLFDEYFDNIELPKFDNLQEIIKGSK